MNGEVRVATISVSQFVQLADGALAALGDISVEGEVSNFQVKSGKWVLFDLKDAESHVSCFMPVWDLKTAIEDGMLVRAMGEARIKKWGQFSFNVRRVTPAGEGALKRAFDLLRQKLIGEGLFAPERKRPLPLFPEHVALITSRDAAAYNDFLKVLQARIGGLTISFIHTQVQGEDAPRQIIAALETANTRLANVDAVVMVRGGGSLEDLQSFNDELIVRAVSASRVPIIVGVGHERDITLAELAADLRASTPSNAAELLVRSRDELSGEVKHMRLRLTNAAGRQVRHYQEETRHFARTIILAMKREAAMRRQGIAYLTRVLTGLSPQETLNRGYSITRTENGSVVKSGSTVRKGEVVRTRLAQGEIWSTVGGR